MKIIIINNLYSPWARGGAEQIAEKTADGLSEQGHEVFVISTAPKQSRTEKVFYLPSIFYNLDKYSLSWRFFWHLWDIVNFAKEVHADFIVVGIVKTSRVEKALMGSTAQNVILEAPCPVITVK